MKKQRPINFLFDALFLLNVFIFIGVGIAGLKESLGLAITSFSFATMNIGYFVQSVINRIKLYKLNEERRKLEYLTEERLAEDKVDINIFKQRILESRIEAEILKHFPNAKVIKNAYVPKKDGNYSEIDVIALTESGIFVIESKNINGDIYGTWDQENLIVEHPGGEQYELPNPINQNSVHFYALKDIVGYRQNYFRNIVVFGDNTYIKSFKEIPHYARICKIDRLISSMNLLSKKHSIKLEEHEIDTIYNVLAPFVERTDEKEAQHINRIKETIN